MHTFHKGQPNLNKVEKVKSNQAPDIYADCFFFTNTENLKKSEFKIKKCTFPPPPPPQNNVNKIVQLCCFSATDLLLWPCNQRRLWALQLSLKTANN